MWQPHADIEVSKSVLRDWINIYPDDKFYQWAIVLKDNGDEPIGGISVVHMDEKVAAEHIGYCLGKKWWHKGIMSEALKAVLNDLAVKLGVKTGQVFLPHSCGVFRRWHAPHTSGHFVPKSGSLRCFPSRGIPFRTVIIFSRCYPSMNYPKSTPKQAPVPYIRKVGNRLKKQAISALSELW